MDDAAANAVAARLLQRIFAVADTEPRNLKCAVDSARRLYNRYLQHHNNLHKNDQRQNQNSGTE